MFTRAALFRATWFNASRLRGDLSLLGALALLFGYASLPDAVVLYRPP